MARFPRACTLPAETAAQRHRRQRWLAAYDQLLGQLEECNLARQEPPTELRLACWSAGAAPLLRSGPELHNALLDLQIPYVRLPLEEAPERPDLELVLA